MKGLLKYAVVLLILLSMAGMASATISVSDDGGTGDTSSYSIEISWNDDNPTPSGYLLVITGPDGATTEVYNNSASSPYTFSSTTLTAGNYLATVSNDSDSTDFGTTSFSVAAPAAVLAQPSITNFKSTSDSTGTQFNVTWDWTQVNDETLQINSKGTWTDVTGNTAMVGGNVSEDTVILIRATNGTSPNILYSDFVPVATFEYVNITEVNTTNSITWTLSNWTNYINYTVNNSTTTVSSGDTVTGNTITVNSLTAGETYTLEVRGTDGTNYSLFNTNTVTLAAANLFDVTEMEDFLNSDGTVKTLDDIEKGTTFKLKAVTTSAVSFSWVLNYTDDTTNNPIETKNNVTSATEDTFEWKPDTTGNYTLELTIDDGTNPTQTLTWTLKVIPSTTGDRIWDESDPDKSLGDTYNWTARSFSGFYYDLDTGQGSEFMKIENIGRTIAKGDIYYETTTSDVDFEYDGWDSYQIVGFMGDKYYAGSGSDSLMKNGNLSKVLIDNDDSENYRVGQYIALEEGYSVRIDQIDVNGNAALLVVEKDGKELNSSVVNINNNATFTYEKNISGTKVPFIMIHVRSVFMGTESSLVTIDGIFQISDDLVKLESGTEIDKMEIDSVNIDSSTGNGTITMTNSERVSLSQDSEVTLMGKMKFIVADSSTLRFAPTIEYTDPGIYEIRGTVSDFGNSEYIVYEWTPQNFEGFYYDINDDIADSESITIETDLSSTRRIADGELIYTANTTVVDYEYDGWTNYVVIGFMGEKYYAGTGGGLLSNGNLSKVLVDTDEKRNMYVNQSLSLEEGVSVRASQIDVNGNRALLVVEKDGKELYSEIVQSGSDLNYSKKIGSGSENTTFVRVHVDAVFMGTESSLVTISGIFQASDELTKIEEGTTYGKMEVTSVSSTGIVMENDGSITLSNGDDVEFMKVGNNSMYFKVGDSDDNTLRFAPVVEKEIGSSDPLDVQLSDSSVVSGDTVTITVLDRGVTIEGVTVTINGSTVGTTNSSGEINYTTSAVGTFRVNAEKSGYTAGNASLTVAEKLINMTVRVSPETVYFGTAATITATDSLNGTALGDAEVFISGEKVGTTNSSGMLSHTFNTTGNVTINVMKDKYNNGTTTINVSQEVAFVYSSFSMSPDEPSAKKAIKLTFTVTNNGIKDGSHDMSLILRDSSGNIVAQDNSTVSVDMGKSKNVSLSVKPTEEGTYTLTLVETSSGNRTIDLPSSMSTVTVGEAKFGSTILYIILAFLAIIVIAVIGFVAYLFGVKGATKDNYQYVAQEIFDDVKSKFKKK
ncbi:hypothetical protein MmiHf6_10180 [Methanimicrococcus hongohii]|uniref:S-layer protein n=1 Tax=Methanimicrococcus hongohii TaxID=3028295 RepID=A0AA96ZSS0_9EURY|nr:S-layer protein domain-containing protein [Methanimicrococcus sp. Hf6]WNY23705.1 hypothetical protein MmiHf6_10180 [Methanimicrococcus sp. Hf6]